MSDEAKLDLDKKSRKAAYRFDCPVCGQNVSSAGFSRSRHESSHIAGADDWCTCGHARKAHGALGTADCNRARCACLTFALIVDRAAWTRERFWGLVDATGECWLWLGEVTSSGYGNFRRLKERDTAHILSWLVYRSGRELPRVIIDANSQTYNPESARKLAALLTTAAAWVEANVKRWKKC